MIHNQFLELSIIIFKDIKMRTWSWSAIGYAGWPGSIQLQRLVQFHGVAFFSQVWLYSVLTAQVNYFDIKIPYISNKNGRK